MAVGIAILKEAEQELAKTDNRNTQRKTTIGTINSELPVLGQDHGENEQVIYQNQELAVGGSGPKVSRPLNRMAS